jgi:hypothetical protein
MKRVVTGVVVAVGAAGVGAAGVAGLRRRSRGGGTHADRWHTVTVNRVPEEVGHLPEPLDRLGHAVEVRIRPAPGDRGTELAVRLPGTFSGREPVRELRQGLREAKQLLEVGEVLLPDTPPTTRRTVLGRPLAYLTRHGREEGRL